MAHFDYRKLTPAQQEERIRAARAKADMSRYGIPLMRASSKNHLTGRAVLRWFPGSIVLDDQRRYTALPDDEVFPMIVITTRGTLELDVRGSTERQAVGAHHDAIRRLLDLDIGDERALRDMRGTIVAGRELETDPGSIEDLLFSGELDFLEIYLTDQPDQ